MFSKWTRQTMRGTLCTPETWEGDRRRTSLEIGEAGAESVSPDLVLWGDADHGVIVGQDVLLPGAPPQEVAESLRRAIASPASGGGRPRQPRRIRVTSAEIAEAIRPVADSLGIQLEVAEQLPLLDDVFRTIEVRFGSPSNLGYLDATEAPEALMAEFFSAAGDFYRRRPWRYLEDAEPVLLECADWVPDHRYAVVFGGLNEVRGLALYNSWKGVLALVDLSREDPEFEDAIRRVAGTAMLYTPTNMLGERRLEEARSHEWELASRNAYPVVIGTGSRRESHWPTPGELRALIAAMRVLPPFLKRLSRNRETVEQGGFFVETQEVDVSGETVEVDALFPVPVRVE